MSEEIELKDDDGNVIGRATVGVGDPSSPYHGQLLSMEDERRLDSKGQEVVRGLPWADTATGLYLAVLCSNGPVKADRHVKGGTSVSVNPTLSKGADIRMFVGTFLGKPSFANECWGAAIELPSDLGHDEIKRKYLTEWIAHTSVESLSGFGIGFDMSHTTLGDTYKKLAMTLTWAAEDAIRDAGL